MVSLVRGLFEVEIMADSYVRVPKRMWAPGYHRLTSIRARFPRIVLAEVNTHRLMSRNSASSRAEPANKMRERIASKPFVPDRFPEEHKGMQQLDVAKWVVPGHANFEKFIEEWLWARDQLVMISERLSALGISKQLTNRFLEPVSMHEIILSATEWENFFFLRADAPAQNEIRILAEMILEAMNSSVPCELAPGEWHTPFGEQIDQSRLIQMLGEASDQEAITEHMLKIIVARCARVSYRNFEGKDDYHADILRYNDLLQSGHWSPFEHVAKAMGDEYRQYTHTTPDYIEYGWCGNFRGFIQLRKEFERDRENRRDPRLIPLDV